MDFDCSLRDLWMKSLATPHSRIHPMEVPTFCMTRLIRQWSTNEARFMGLEHCVRLCSGFTFKRIITPSSFNRWCKNTIKRCHFLGGSLHFKCGKHDIVICNAHDSTFYKVVLHCISHYRGLDNTIITIWKWNARGMCLPHYL